MTTSAFDAIGRGFATLRANWQLVPMLWLQQVLVLALFALGAAVPLAVIGVDRLAALAAWRPAGAGEWIDDASAAVAPLALPLAVALLASAVVWTLAALVFCWFQGGACGVLLAAERQAPPGPPRDWRLFRTYERDLFAGWGRGLVWRYFGFWNLWGLAFLGWFLALVLLLVAAQVAAAEWGLSGLSVVGLGGSLALAVGTLVLAGWGLVAPLALAREDATVAGASRRALGLLVRRPLAVALVVAVFLGVWVVVAIALQGLGAPLMFLDPERRLGLWIAAQALVTMLHLAGTVAVSTGLNGALAALVVERARSAELVPAGEERRSAAVSEAAARSLRPWQTCSPPAPGLGALDRWSEVPR